jgi:hypothetical protein
MLIAHAKDSLEGKLQVLLSELQVLFPGELYSTNFREEGYQFLALHFS